MKLGSVTTARGSTLTVYVEQRKVVLEYPCDSHAPMRRELDRTEANDLAALLRSGGHVLEARG